MSDGIQKDFVTLTEIVLGEQLEKMVLVLCLQTYIVVLATHNMLYWLSQIMTCNNVTYILHTGAWSSAHISWWKSEKFEMAHFCIILGLYFVFGKDVDYRLIWSGAKSSIL